MKLSKYHIGLLSFGAVFLALTAILSLSGIRIHSSKSLESKKNEANVEDEIKEEIANAKEKYKYTARIDMKNCGAEENEIILLKSSEEKLDFATAGWWSDSEGNGYSIHSNSRNLDLEVKIQGDGVLNLYLRGRDYKTKDKKRVHLKVTYNDVVVDGEKVLSGETVIWHDSPFIWSKPVVDGQVVKLHFEWDEFNEINISKNKYKDTARIDIKNHGLKTNTFEILSYSDDKTKFENPAWFTNDEGIGFVAISNEKSLSFDVKAIGDGTFTLALRGVDVHSENNERMKLEVDYTKLIVDDEVIFNDKKTIWHDQPFTYSKNIKDGQNISVHVEWQETKHE